MDQLRFTPVLSLGKHICLPEQRVILVGLPWAVNLEWFFLLGAWWITTTPFKDYWYFRKGIQEGRHGSIDC